jgi:hypothetical protein
MQLEITKSVLEYAKYCPPHMGKLATSDEKVGKYVKRPGEVCGEIRLVKGWFGIGQEVSECMIGLNKILRKILSIKGR